MKAKLIKGEWTIFNTKNSDDGYTTIIPNHLGGITYEIHKTLSEAECAINQYNKSKPRVNEHIQKMNDYCLKNPWTRYGT